MKIGIPLLWENPLFRKLLLPALMIFLIFYKLIFSPLVKKHHQRIMRMSVAKMTWYNFFDRKSYLIMICMMTLGILIRKLQLVPEWNIAFFYSGLG
jgi:membrane protein